jgi:general secretion pathway protein K
MALLFVLLVLSLLVTLILGFDADARRELKEAAAFRDGFKATTLARAGVQAARATLRIARPMLRYKRSMSCIWSKG